MKRPGLWLAAVLLAACGSLSASVTEIRRNFFNQQSNLNPTAIMAAPIGDASYLISIYESTASCAILPTLRWIDENGVARSQRGTVGPVSVELPAGNCYVSLLALIRVQAKTAPTIETEGDDNAFVYFLYVSGLGFWPSGAQGQAGLSEVSGSLPVGLVHSLPVYKPPVSTSALIVASSTGFSGQSIPFLSWTDENGNNSLRVPVETSVVVPVRIAGHTKVWIHSFPGDTTWYAIIVFGTPGAGPGPFGDYEENLLNWTNAGYPKWQTPFTAASTGSNVLLMSNVTQMQNNGPLSEGLQACWTSQMEKACAPLLPAAPSGVPSSWVASVFLDSDSPLEVRTYNASGAPWGPSPRYSAEVDVLVF